MGRVENESGYGKVNSFFTKPVVVLLITTIIGPIISGVIVNNFTKDRTYEAVQKATVEMLSTKLDYIDASDQLADAINEIALRNEKANSQSAENDELLKEKDKEIEKKDKEIETLNSTINSLPKIEYNSIGVVLNGLKTEEIIKNGWASIDGKNYFSENSVNSLLEFKIHLDEDTKTLFYDDSGNSNPKETKISLEESNTLYDGLKCTYYKSSEPGTFSLGSNTYKSGFTLKTGYNGRADGDYSNALFDLKGKYSKISFDVGKVTGENNLNAIMSIYIDGEHSQDYNLSVNVVSKHFDIDLNYADDLMIQIHINAYDSTRYGFANVVFEY